MRQLLDPAGTVIPGVRRIAVLRPLALGDVVLALPALEALRAAYPGAEITFLGASWLPGFLTGRPGPWDRVVAIPAYPGVPDGPDLPRDSPEIRRFFQAASAAEYDLVLQLNGGGANSNPFVRRLGAGITVGSRDRDADALDRWVPYDATQHEMLRTLEVTGLAGVSPVTLQPRVTLTAADRAAAEAVLPPGDRPLVVLHPGANDPRRRWPPECFGDVATTVARAGCDVAIVGTATDRVIARGIATADGGEMTDLTGRLDLGGLAGVLSRATLVVANDSGPRHLAAAVGAATVGIFWWRNLTIAGPLLRARHRVAVSERRTCPDCGADQLGARCPHDPSFVADVPPAQVIGVALELLESELATQAMARAG